MKEAEKETRSQHSKLTYHCGLWIYASNHVCPNKYKAVAFSSCVLLPPTAQSTASAYWCSRNSEIQEIKDTRTIPPPLAHPQCVLKSEVLCFEIWSLWGAPSRVGEKPAVCSSAHGKRQPEVHLPFKGQLLLCPPWFHAGGDSLHYTVIGSSEACLQHFSTFSWKMPAEHCATGRNWRRDRGCRNQRIIRQILSGEEIEWIL